MKATIFHILKRNYYEKLEAKELNRLALKYRVFKLKSKCIRGWKFRVKFKKNLSIAIEKFTETIEKIILKRIMKFLLNNYFFGTRLKLRIDDKLKFRYFNSWKSSSINRINRLYNI